MAKARVLFVCIENSCRSQMAEGLARLRAADVLEPASAGSRPSGVVDPAAVQVMREVGYDLTPHVSKPLSSIPAEHFVYVITMGCGDDCPFIPADHHEDWSIPDPKGKPLDAYREVRGSIDQKVCDLADRVRMSARG
jgi:arsenate reductase (thioredoxin)